MLWLCLIWRNIHTYTNTSQPFKLCIMISHLLCFLSPTHLTIKYILPWPFTRKSHTNPTSETMIHYSKHGHIISMKNLADVCRNTARKIPRKYNEVSRIQCWLQKNKPPLISVKWSCFKLHGSRDSRSMSIQYPLCALLY